MRVLMTPNLGRFEDTDESGIKRVVAAYEKYAKQFDIDYVKCDLKEVDKYDLYAVHAGTSNAYPPDRPIISHLHGLYWSADYVPEKWELAANKHVIDSIIVSNAITVPSEWVAETIRREVRIDPWIIHHGVDWQEWQHSEDNLGYVLWNKNRFMDVCSPEAVRRLAKHRPDIEFFSTFAPPNCPDNVFSTGVVPHIYMKKMIQQAGVYLSTTKETFGIGTLEALASGVPVLGFAHGGNLITIQHGVNGYLAKPEDYNDLMEGLNYCLKYRDILGDNARETAKAFTWEKALEKVALAYQDAIKKYEPRLRPHILGFDFMQKELQPMQEEL